MMHLNTVVSLQLMAEMRVIYESFRLQRVDSFSHFNGCGFVSFKSIKMTKKGQHLTSLLHWLRLSLRIATRTE